MPEEPSIKGLSKGKRSAFFWVLVLIFLATLPSLIFYTTGYRLSFEDDERSIVTTGGVYVTTDNLEVDVYLDEVQVEKPRLFRSAYYVQNIEAGNHRIVVQQPGLHTWVKELPVYPYIVSEAAAFNMPVIPQLRPITPHETATGTQIFVDSETEELFAESTSTVPFQIVAATSSRLHQVNEEYIFVESLFATTTTNNESVFSRFMNGVGRFGFATTSDSQATATEAVIERGDMRLIADERDLYALWTGEIDSVPHYFCIPEGEESVAERYGAHVADSIENPILIASSTVSEEDGRVCRQVIKLDRKRQDVFFYDFFPNSADLVLLQLEDGLYVTEIDDRAWQNTQQIYSGSSFRTVIDNGNIYIKEGDRISQLNTEIETN